MTNDEFLTQLLYPDGNLTSDPERIAEWRRWKILLEKFREVRRDELATGEHRKGLH